MLYSAILWAVILGIVLLCFIARYCNPVSRQISPSVDNEKQRPPTQSTLYRIKSTLDALYHRYLLPESALPRVFGPTTRFNVLLLAILIIYLTIFTFVGIVYQTWTSPTGPNQPDTIRVGFGPWADRIGVLAYALTPLSVLLCTRESLLSLFTGIPYHHFNFLHRWLGWIIYIQSVLHTLGWTLVEGELYQPQPTTWDEFVRQRYVIWGIVAMIFLSFIVFGSLQCVIRRTGYEFFRKSHYVVAMLYVGACWGHWSKLSCWMIASLAVWGTDRGLRLLRTLVLHLSSSSSSSSSSSPSWRLQIPKAQLTFFTTNTNNQHPPPIHEKEEEKSEENEESESVIRIDFHHPHSGWEIGQHFYLCFPDLSIWQSHPMTPASVPDTASGVSLQPHTYLIRAKTGITRALAATHKQHPKPDPDGAAVTTPIVLSGPYGHAITDDDLHCTDDINIFCAAGGTGVTFVLPLLQAVVLNSYFPSRKSIVEFVWVVRHRADVRWIQAELDALRVVAERCAHFRVRVFVTRDVGGFSGSASDSNSEVECGSGSVDGSGLDSEFKPFEMRCLRPSLREPPVHPDVPRYLRDFVDKTPCGPTRVFASGPAGLVSSLRGAVAQCNDAGRVWQGQERYSVQLVHDDRLEW
ncbi:ferric reductase like transmembrane component-domain-containing protein [Aspergillus taichungensis]|uniref:Ferric reductase like transmembrane component-domain-containing protein n=1 Tax=Aspergillus taichungensis TaxID=482145 RepID=A0A2J5HDP8_9EURO|nr:ferric reductase like transmembrane component-domain-containing protein [Aspergillus taichungensis]